MLAAEVLQATYGMGYKVLSGLGYTPGETEGKQAGEMDKHCVSKCQLSGLDVGKDSRHFLG